MSRPIIVRPRRASPILVCKKCLKRSEEGSAVRRELKRELKRQRNGELKPPRLVATSCFGICPKRAIVLTSGSTLNKGQYVLVSDRADLERALDLLRSSN